jgi:hypothetical protein
VRREKCNNDEERTMGRQVPLKKEMKEQLENETTKPEVDALMRKGCKPRVELG